MTRGPKECLKKHLTLVGNTIPSKEDVKQSQITITGTQMSTELSSHNPHCKSSIYLKMKFFMIAATIADPKQLCGTALI